MAEKVLILGASGTVGAAVYQRLNQCKTFDVYGPYYSAKPQDGHMYYFSLEHAEQIRNLLEELSPSIVISALRGDFGKQAEAHMAAAEYVRDHQGRLLYFSTANVFDGKPDSPHYERDDMQSVSVYGKFKIFCENSIREILGKRAVIIRIPFVYGKNAPRMQQLEEGLKKGVLEVYQDLQCNYVTDMQIADYVEWIIKERKEGIFHVGTTDVLRYTDFVENLIKESGKPHPVFRCLDAAGTMAVLTERKDIPQKLEWNVERVVKFLVVQGQCHI